MCTQDINIEKQVKIFKSNISKDKYDEICKKIKDKSNYTFYNFFPEKVRDLITKH